MTDDELAVASDKGESGIISSPAMFCLQLSDLVYLRTSISYKLMWPLLSQLLRNQV